MSAVIEEQKLKNCQGCCRELPLGHFYQIKSKKERSVRWEKICKSCKRKKRQSKKEDSRPSPVANVTPRQPPPEETIEPRNSETKELINTIDFSELEKACGRQLVENEKYDAVQRLNEFVSIVLEEYSKIVGHDVFIKRQD